MRDHTAMPEIDLNVDAGESFGAWRMGDDAALFAEVSSANLACGFHAGDPGTIRTSLALAIEAGVAIGAHPGLPDLVGFGRRPLTQTPQQVRDDTLYQLGAMYAFVRAAGATLHHLKPHGALNTAVAESSDEHADAIVTAVREFDPDLPIIAIAGSRLHRAASAREPRGRRRGLPGPRLRARRLARQARDPRRDHPRRRTMAAARAVRMALDGTVEAIDGTVVELQPGTLCIHGDNPNSVPTAKAIRAALEREGVTIRAF